MAHQASGPRHARLTVAAALLATASICYPYLPGRYDALASPLSIVVQAFGLVGTVLLVPVGVAWTAFDRWSADGRRPERRARALAAAFPRVVVLATLAVALLLVLVASLAVGYSPALLAALAILCGVAARRRIRAVSYALRSEVAAWYLVALPITVLAAQLVLETSVTNRSRRLAMSNARTLVLDLEDYRARHGRYPLSLAAIYGDYDPGVIGIARYHYAAREDGYDLYFEQPLFLLDDVGAREFVVYNPREDHRMISHAGWILDLGPEAVRANQGWYRAADAGLPRWRAFRFD